MVLSLNQKTGYSLCSPPETEMNPILTTQTHSFLVETPLKRSLLALGHIIMDPPAGRRGRGLHLTPKGQAVLKEAFPVWQGAQSRAVAALGENSRVVLDDLLSHAEKLGASS